MHQMIDKQKEEEFYAKDFNFSYSSLNKLFFVPSIFYREYILQDKEVKTDKHLIEGKLLHLLLLQPEKLNDEFSIVPSKVPSDNVRKVLNALKNDNKNIGLEDLGPDILLVLKEQNLYQSLKEDSKRLEKIQTPDNIEYFKFLQESGKDIIDNDMLHRAKDRVELMKQNKDVMSLLQNSDTDFELDSGERFVEKYLQCKLKNYDFGIHGYVDFYKVDHENKTVTICDIKTTGKSIEKFEETVEYYNYWLQASIYYKLIYENLEVKNKDDYKIIFKFVVIDHYNQVYVFDVSDETLQGWAWMFAEKLQVANYHYSEKDYSLPYDFATNKIKL